MSRAPEQLIAEMLDREAIRDLPNRYCHHVWARDIEALLSLFTKDASFSNQTGQRRTETKGIDALRAMWSGSLDEIKPHPFIHNHVFELHGPASATGVCYFDLRVGSQMNWGGAGFYDDEYAKDDGTWKFSARTCHLMTRSAELAQTLAEQVSAA